MYRVIEVLVGALKAIIPTPLIGLFRTPYHFIVTYVSALYYGFPGKKLTIIMVTGTKGKSTVSEMLYTVLKDAGYKTAVASTIRFAIDNSSEPNLFKMTLPGRGFIQSFLARAVKQGCTHAVVEVTSESTRQFRHWFLFPNALVFTNLQKEHIESHGSMAQYAQAKFKIGKALAHSLKRPRAIIANGDDARSKPYLALPVEHTIPFSYSDALAVELKDGAVSFSVDGVPFEIQLPGSYNVMNGLAVIRSAQFVGVPLPTIAKSLAALERIPGRTERIVGGQSFQVIVDYAHTPDSLQALYSAYPGKKICVLGNTGGGRDTWKRPEMGRIAEEACSEVILTDEDPYDENPKDIVDEMARGMKRAPTIIMDRREAIRTALTHAKPGDAVLISGKGTDPYIMKANGEKLPWSDAQVVREELEKLPKSS